MNFLKISFPRLHRGRKVYIGSPQHIRNTICGILLLVYVTEETVAPDLNFMNVHIGRELAQIALRSSSSPASKLFLLSCT